MPKIYKSVINLFYHKNFHYHVILLSSIIIYQISLIIIEIDKNLDIDIQSRMLDHLDRSFCAKIFTQFFISYYLFENNVLQL